MVFVLLGCGKSFYKAADKSFQNGIQSQPYDAIIVPGYPHNGESWDRVVQMRVYWAKYLYDKGYAKNIIFSGGAVATKYIESRIMAYYAHALGVRSENLFTEERAEHSTENVYYSYRLAKENGFKKIALATDPFQSRYMQKFSKKFELPINFLPMVIDTLKTFSMEEPAIDPKPAIQEGFVKLSDRENFFERFRGTLGKNIKWHEEDLKKKKFKRRYRENIIPVNN